MQKPQKYKGKVVKADFITDTVIHCRIEHIEPSEMHFDPGQYFVISVDKGINRAYSIGCSSEETKFVETFVDITPGGPGSKFFASLKVGTEVEYMGPMGRFVFKDDGKPTLFVSTGTGIVPFVPMLDKALKNETCQKYLLLEGLRYKNDIYLDEKFSEWKQSHPEFQYEYCLSRDDSWEGKKGRVTDHLDEAVNNLGKDINVYVCGNKDATTAIVDKLIELGVPKEQIMFEKY